MYETTGLKEDGTRQGDDRLDEMISDASDAAMPLSLDQDAALPVAVSQQRASFPISAF